VDHHYRDPFYPLDQVEAWLTEVGIAPESPQAQERRSDYYSLPAYWTEELIQEVIYTVMRSNNMWHSPTFIQETVRRRSMLYHGKAQDLSDDMMQQFADMGANVLVRQIELKKNKCISGNDEHDEGAAEAAEKEDENTDYRATYEFTFPSDMIGVTCASVQWN
jgi:hypothetical protein